MQKSPAKNQDVPRIGERPSPAGKSERTLRDALYALNRAIGAAQEAGLGHAAITTARDDVWELGQRLYGWKLLRSTSTSATNARKSTD